MANSRLIQEFAIVDGANTLRVNHSVDGNIDVTVPAGTLAHSDDGTATDFNQTLVDLLDAASTTVTWSLGIQGVDGLALADTAEGRMRLAVSSGTFIVKWSDTTNTKLPPGLLGHQGTSDAASSLTVLVSSFVHRYGWYPQTFHQSAPWDPELVHAAGQATDGQVWDSVTWAELDVLRPLWACVPEEFMREASNTSSARMTAHYLTVDDPWCSLQRFLLDAARNNNGIRMYADNSDPNTYIGPYYLPGTDQSEIRKKPLILSDRLPAAPNWRARIEAVRAV